MQPAQTNSYRQWPDHSRQGEGTNFSYRLIVAPTPVVEDLLLQEKIYASGMVSAHQIKFALHEIVIGKFEAAGELEGLVLKWLQNALNGIESFPVLFNNYGSMPGQPLFIRVHDPAPFRALSDAIQVLEYPLTSNGCSALRLFRHPRLPVADHIGEEVSMQLLLDFSGRTFRKEMVVEELLLIKRSYADGPDKIVSKLKLLPAGLKSQAKLISLIQTM